MLVWYGTIELFASRRARFFASDQGRSGADGPFSTSRATPAVVSLRAGSVAGDRFLAGQEARSV
jgi:hypothetical protein